MYEIPLQTERKGAVAICSGTSTKQYRPRGGRERGAGWDIFLSIWKMYGMEVETERKTWLESRQAGQSRGR